MQCTDQFQAQNHSQATYAKKIEKKEAKINWNDNAKNIIAKINALNPNPGCWFYLNRERIKVYKAQENSLKGNPGQILDNKFSIACSDYAVQILELIEITLLYKHILLILLRQLYAI